MTDFLNKNRYVEYIAFSFLILCAIALRLSVINRGFYYDELWLVTQGLQSSHLFGVYFSEANIFTNHIGYTILTYPLCHLLGIKEWTVRLPALFFGIGSIVVFWFWTRECFGKLTAFLGAALLSFAPPFIFLSVSGRGYSALVFFTLLSISLYFYLLEKPSKKVALLFAFINAVAISFHFYFIFILLAEILHLFLISIFSILSMKSSLNKRSVLNAAVAFILTIILSALIYSPIFIYLGRFISGQADHGVFKIDFPVTAFMDLLSLPLIPLGSACLVLMFLGLFDKNEKLTHWRLFVSILFFTFIPIWLAKPWFLYSRFFIFLLPFIFLGIANSFSVVGRICAVSVRPFVFILMAIVVSLVLWSWHTTPSRIVEKDCKNTFKEAAQFAQNVAVPSTAFCAFGNQDGFFQFYSDRPVRTFRTFDEFKAFDEQGGDKLCFSFMGPPMDLEQKKITLFILTNGKFKNFGQNYVFYLKQPS